MEHELAIPMLETNGIGLVLHGWKTLTMSNEPLFGLQYFVATNTFLDYPVPIEHWGQGYRMDKRQGKRLVDKVDAIQSYAWAEILNNERDGLGGTGCAQQHERSQHRFKTLNR